MEGHASSLQEDFRLPPGPGLRAGGLLGATGSQEGQIPKNGINCGTERDLRTVLFLGKMGPLSHVLGAQSLPISPGVPGLTPCPALSVIPP